MVSAADGGLEADLDEEDLKDLSSDEVYNDQGGAGQAVESDADLPEGVEREEAEEEDQRGAAHRVPPDPGEPTGAEVESPRLWTLSIPQLVRRVRGVTRSGRTAQNAQGAADCVRVCL